MKRFLLLLLTVTAVIIPQNGFSKVVLASGAGYRSAVDPLADYFEKTTGIPVERIYGNMARVTAQAKTVGTVDLVLGDASFLTKAELPFISTTPLGQGRLVAIYPKGKPVNSTDDFLSDNITRIAIPEPAKAIYGKAAVEFLKNAGLYNQLEPKLLVVATVPQAASYVLSGEVDVALINMTHATKIQGKIGGYYELDTALYAPINIIIGRMDNSSASEDCTKFIAFVQSDEAKAILADHGLLNK